MYSCVSMENNHLAPLQICRTETLQLIPPPMVSYPGMVIAIGTIVTVQLGPRISGIGIDR